MEMAGPTITVITAAYNSSATLRIALESLLAQTFVDWESWVIGDGCSDDSEEVVRNFGDARLHWHNLETNRGSQAFPNNEGLRRARGRYIAYLGHDDIWLPDHLSVLKEFLEDGDFDLAHSICGAFDSEHMTTCWGPPKYHLGYEGHFVPPSCWLHRRELVEETGYWSNPDELALAVDMEFLRRIHRGKKRIGCCRRFTVVKITSGSIRLYSLTGEPPQAGYWRRVQGDVRGLERELLGEGGALLAEQFHGHPPFLALAEKSFRIAARELRRMTEGWPGVRYFWRWLYQHTRRQNRRARGLPRR